MTEARHKRARTLPPTLPNERAAFLAPDSLLGKRAVEETDVSPSKKARLTPVDPGRAAQWVLHDLREKLQDQPDLLAFLQEREAYYNDNPPEGLPRKSRKRDASPIIDERPDKKAREPDRADEMDIDGPTTPKATQKRPLGFARFANSKRSSPLQAQPAAVPQQVSSPAGKPDVAGGFAAFAQKGHVRFDLSPQRETAGAFSGVKVDPKWSFPRAGATPETAIELEEPAEGASSQASTNATDDGRADFWIRQGDKALERGRVQDAIDVYKKAAEIDETSLNALLKLARAQLGAQQTQEVSALLAGRGIPADTDISTLLDVADVCCECYLFKKAADLYELVLSRDPANDRAAKGLHDCDAIKSVGVEAAGLISERKWQDVDALLRRHIHSARIVPPDWLTKRLRAVLELRPIPWDDASRLAEKLKTLASEDPEATYLRGMWAFHNELETSTKSLWRKTLSFDPDHAEAKRCLPLLPNVRLGHSQLSNAQYRTAVESYTTLINGGLRTCWLFVARATCLQQLHQYETAIRDCIAALQIRSDHHTALHRQGLSVFWLAKQSSGRKDWSDAIQRFEAAEALFDSALKAFERSPLSKETGSRQFQEKLATERLQCGVELLKARKQKKKAEEAQRQTRSEPEAASDSQQKFYSRGAPGGTHPKVPPSFSQWWNSDGSYARSGGTGAGSGTRRGESHWSGWNDHPRQSRAREEPPAFATPSIAKHYKTLGLPYGSSVETVKVAFRDLSRTRHPDKGGSVSGFQEISHARDEILSWLA